MPFLDGGRNRTHCGNPFCGQEITAEDILRNNFHWFDTNRLDYPDSICVLLNEKWQIVHTQCPKRPEHCCKKCKKDHYECTCGQW